MSIYIEKPCANRGLAPQSRAYAPTPPRALPRFKPSPPISPFPHSHPTMASEATPRINAHYLDSFTDQTVRLLGTVTSLRGDTATLDANGSVTIHLNRVLPPSPPPSIPYPFPSLSYPIPISTPTPQLIISHPVAIPGLPPHTQQRRRSSRQSAE